MQRVRRARLQGQISFRWFGGLQQLRLRSSLDKQRENQIHASAVIVPESILVEIGLQIFFADSVIDAAQTTLHQTPKSFNGVGVHISQNVNASPPASLFATLQAQLDDLANPAKCEYAERRFPPPNATTVF